MFSLETLILRLLLALVAGGIIGAEREYRNKSAGFRTMILISLGSCLFTFISLQTGYPNNSDRIASNIVTGIGFLGAGVIFKSDDHIKGLTTATTIWLTAALGMGIGAGYYIISLIVCLFALLVLVAFTLLEGWIDRANQIRMYKIVCAYKEGRLKVFEQEIHKHRLKYKRNKQCRTGSDLIGIWEVRGKEKNHDSFIKELLNDSSIKEVEF